jgi:hypothetical protein
MFSSSRRAAAGFPVLAMVLCLVVLLGSPRGHAQRGGTGRPNMSSNKQPYTIPVTVRRVVLDVVVTDSHGNPVQGLTKKDFSVLEEKKSQEIRSFEEFDFRAPSNFVAPKIPSMPPDTYMNVATAPERGPLYVIVYDAVHIKPEDQAQARKQLADFLESRPEGTRFALFLLAKDFRLLQGFTTDTNKLLATFDLRRWEPGRAFASTRAWLWARRTKCRSRPAEKWRPPDWAGGALLRPTTRRRLWLPRHLPARRRAP